MGTELQQSASECMHSNESLMRQLKDELSQYNVVMEFPMNSRHVL